MKCFFCSEEIEDNTFVCPWCGRRQKEATQNTPPSPPNSDTYASVYIGSGEQILSQNIPPDPAVHKQSKADEYFGKGMKSFFEAYTASDREKAYGHLNRAQGYLTMAYKAAGDDIEEKKGTAGLMAFVLTEMDDCKNAEAWAKEELTINPTNVFARLARYPIELAKWVGHKGFILPSDGSGPGMIANLLSWGIDAKRVQNKKNVIKTAAIEAAKAIENKAQTDPQPNPLLWLIWSWILLTIIENMWKNNMKEPYLCNVLLNLPWNRFTDEEIKDFQEPIEEIQVQAHGFLGRLK